MQYPLETQARAEMLARKTRHYKQAKRRELLELAGGVALFALVIIVMLAYMVAFAD